jgi:hypothetical protein
VFVSRLSRDLGHQVICRRNDVRDYAPIVQGLTEFKLSPTAAIPIWAIERFNREEDFRRTVQFAPAQR